MGELVKALSDTQALLEHIARAWKWLTEVQDWDSWQGWLARISIWAAVVLGCLWLIKFGLEWYVAILESWKKAGLPIPMTAAQREAVRRRSQFCRVLRSDLDALNKTESWNDQFYTDLEAEIEAQGWYYASRFDALIRRRSWGLRRVRSLSKAIETSTDQALLLVGEPGSGKSVALRHLAHYLADRGTKSTDLKAKIPLYVNLKELPAPPDSRPSADWIRTFVIDNVRRGDADTADYIKEHWNTHLHDGTWFFLFDSFDEIPAVMHAPTGSSVIRDYAEAIRQFLAGMNDCRGILASREFKGPETLPWQKFRILPLSTERQDELVQNSFLPPEQKRVVRQHLASSTSNLRQNPLFLTLLCRYVKQENRAPANDHDLLAKHLVRLAERDSDYVAKKYKFTPLQLLDGAMALAVLFATDPQLSLAPTHDQILNALPVESPFRDKLELLLAALVDVKIGRSDVQEAKSGDRRFTFSHRRYQETLFVRYLAIHPARISTQELLLDPRWREYAVALLQTETAAAVTLLIEEATRLITEFSASQQIVPSLPGFGQELGYYDWEGPASHLLTLLQEGLGRRLENVPNALSSEIERLLSARWERGDLLDRAMVLRCGGLLPPDRLSEYITFAVRKNVAHLEEAAFGSVVFLREIPEALLQWLRTRLSNQMLLATKRPEQLRLEALSARLPSGVNGKTILGRCSRIRTVLSPLVRLSQLIVNRTHRTEKIADSDMAVEYVSSWLVLSQVVLIPRILAGSSSLPWLLMIEAPLLLAWVGYIYRAIPDASISSFKQETTISNLWEVLCVVFFLVGPALISPLVRNALGNKYLSGLILLVVVFLLGGLVVAVVGDSFARRRQRTRFKLIQAQSSSPQPLVLQACSIAELNTWLSSYGNSVLPDERTCRSLSRMLMHGISQGSFPMSPENPPLVHHLSTVEQDESEIVKAFSYIRLK